MKAPPIEMLRSRTHGERPRSNSGSCSRWGAIARRPSTSSTHAPSIESEAPAIINTCVGPQRVTSCPNSRCQTSSSGKPESAKAPQRKISAEPRGTCQSLTSRKEVGVLARSPPGPVPSMIPMNPASARPARPMSIG
jgi:hypothetical protein